MIERRGVHFGFWDCGLKNAKSTIRNSQWKLMGFEKSIRTGTAGDQWLSYD